MREPSADPTTRDGRAPGHGRGAVAPRATVRTDEGPDAAPASGTGAARKFVGRVAQLDLDAVSAAVETWRRTMRLEAGAWFAAEEAVARAVVAAGLRGEQKRLVVDIAEAFAHGVWYGARRMPSTPEARVQATEASGQYLATLAMLALLVRDHLEPSTFELLYAPFAPFIPAADLARE